jgi:hypothetical protein
MHEGRIRGIRAFSVQQGSFQIALSLEKMKVLGGEVWSSGRAGPLLEELPEAVIGGKTETGDRFILWRLSDCSLIHHSSHSASQAHGEFDYILV